ncbi:MAG: hypothetical protein R3320_04945 [Nitriliruptorales bacterium]|nr:hypothetical protein [Nitriliruptorales bacterium]
MAALSLLLLWWLWGGRGRGTRELPGTVAVLGTVIAFPSGGSLLAPWTLWLVIAAVSVACVVGVLGRTGRLVAGRLGLPLLIVSIGGLYGTLPDTGHALAILGAVVLAQTLAWPLGPGAVGRPALAFLVLVAGWTVLADGVRPAAFVGGIACLGLLAVLPALAPRRADALGRLRVWVESPPGVAAAVAVHTAYVLVASRGAGLERSAGDAAQVLAWPTAALVAVVATAAIAARRVVTTSEGTARDAAPPA